MAVLSRSRILAPIAFGAGYFAATAIVVVATRFQGGVACLWIATGILTARLVTLNVSHWTPWLVACLTGSALTTALFGFGPAAALPIAAINIGEAIVGALVLRRMVGRRAMLESLRWLTGFIVATGIVAPGIGGILGGLVAHLVSGQPYLRNAIDWYLGHALGTLAVMPIAMLVVRGDVVRLIRATSARKLTEQVALLVLVAAVSIFTFAQNVFPLLFLPLLPIILATFCGGILASAGSIVILAAVGGIFTASGYGPLGLIHASIGTQMQFLQFYLAATMLTILPATAELQRRAELFRRLRDSEARYRMVTDHSTDIVLNLDADGRIMFVSPSIRQIGGHDPALLIGRPITDIVHVDDRPRLREAAAQVLANREAVSTNEYRAYTVSGELRWLEAHSRAVIDDDGSVAGVVSAIRDITHRKAHEDRLALAAMTDPLTSLANRRAFEIELDLRIASGAGGCVAIFDLDRFKHVNDTHGHTAGDIVLQRFAAVARASLRDQDMMARIGGEEFAVVLPEATIEQARLVCDRLRIAVGGTRIHVAGRAIPITVSGGVAAYHPGGSADAVLHDADTALYRAKAAGRDQLALAA